MRIFKRFTHTIVCEPEELDERVKKFCERDDAVILEMKHLGESGLTGGRIFVFLCEQIHGTQVRERDDDTQVKGSNPESGEEEKDTEADEARIIPDGVKSPLVEGFFREGKTRRSVMVMAGIFAVEEGAAFHPDDKEPAPPVLMAPNVDLSVYHNMIFNTPARIMPKGDVSGLDYREEIDRMSKELTPRLGPYGSLRPDGESQ